ncbi:uncharacterized protein CANTADRAFT_6967 [Suhomyces tanzawaensis NRRL Y-17324]|uniref:Zn(2)-C6 fungal-type domain-containing protein n=1 Tax=Suhomyces tanzawaensis NRRL Y-17324 TaxID=984487 RepID=A0A1E4SGH3_9ASCO|nr:uncharacterized protein CANTADRAFT_6967 [Suhomyces tanzawaensis NRRL Y-17324]ODV78611.1 hypothetical protein CANTADRAFT_6967 [Suhomyces tanzawaensis NRRL Y-17324]
MPSKRSRKGCASCKRLKIKCNEDRPRCEYCLHTNRECIYPDEETAVSIISESSRQARRLRDVSLFAHRAQKGLENPDSYFTFDQLVATFTLASPTSHLGISRYELRLVNFFDSFCVPLFSFGVNKDVHNVWKNMVPSLFLRSSLVRNSVYSFAALNLFPLFGLTSVQEAIPYQLAATRSSNSISDLIDTSLSFYENQQNFCDTTNAYFNSAIQKTNILIELELKTSSLEQLPPSPELAAEMTISSILLFSYVCLHPFKVVPLLAWNTDEPDIISITKGIRSTLQICTPIIAQTNYKGLTTLQDDKLVIPPLETCVYPIIASLRDQLTELTQGYDVFDSKILRALEVLKETVRLLHECVCKCIHWNYPVPLFRWLILLLSDFRDLLYERNFYALRILFIFACYSIVTRFEVDDKSNVWIDYIYWYKNYNTKLFGQNQWRYTLDEAFFWLSDSRICVFPHPDFTKMGLLDPEVMFMQAESSSTKNL